MHKKEKQQHPIIIIDEGSQQGPNPIQGIPGIQGRGGIIPP
jgi:hypothetical protein